MHYGKWKNRVVIDSSVWIEFFHIHFDIIDQKIWIQRDDTEDGIAYELEEAGIPKTSIVF